MLVWPSMVKNDLYGSLKIWMVEVNIVVVYAWSFGSV